MGVPRPTPSACSATTTRSSGTRATTWSRASRVGGPGNASRLAMQELLEVRDFVNEGGRALYTGQAAGQQYTPALGQQLYDPFKNAQCGPTRAIAGAAAWRCWGPATRRATRSSTCSGRRSRRRAAASTPTRGSVRRRRDREPLDDLSWGFNGGESAKNQVTNSSFIATGDFLQVTDPADSFPQFESWPAAEYPSGIAGPFDPHTGRVLYVVGSRRRGVQAPDADDHLPGGRRHAVVLDELQPRAGLRLHDRRGPPVGQDDWTTLPNQNGHTTSDLSSDQSCTGGWSNPDDAANVLHPFLTHYQTFDPATGHCSPTGDDRPVERRERQLERLAAVADQPPGRRGSAGRGLDHLAERLGLPAVPGVFIDDIEVSTGEGSTSFEDDGDRWTAGPSPERPRMTPGSRSPTATTGSAVAVSGSRKARPWRPTTRSTWASASRASPAPRRATRSWIARSTTSSFAVDRALLGSP